MLSTGTLDLSLNTSGLAGHSARSLHVMHFNQNKTSRFRDGVQAALPRLRVPLRSLHPPRDGIKRVRDLRLRTHQHWFRTFANKNGVLRTLPLLPPSLPTSGTTP